MARARSPCPPNDITNATRSRIESRPGGDDREAAGKADADDADLAVGAELRLLARPAHRVLDGVGDLRRDLESLQIRRGDGQHAVSGGREIFGEPDQPRFVDAVAMHAGDQDHRASRLPGRPKEARRDVAAAGRHVISGSRVNELARQAATVAGVPGRSAARMMKPSASR